MACCSSPPRIHMASPCIFRPVHGGSAQRDCCDSGARSHTALTQELALPRKRLGNRVRCQQVASPFSSKASSERDFKELADMSGTGLNKVTARTTDNRMGLVATEAIEKGEILIQVPLAACLSFDDEAGITLPEASWTRLATAVAQAQSTERPPTWDMLIALALVDANSGSGDPFTEQYMESFMPSPRDLATPFCQSAKGLEALQHPKVAEAALQRRKILDEAFPDLGNVYLDGTETTPLQWALACVRSRAFQLTSTLFAQVPFCDLANHSNEANAMVRPLRDSEAEETSTPEEEAARELKEVEALEGEVENPSTQAQQRKKPPAAPNSDSLSVVLAATENIAEGSEVKISYTGVSGATNRRLMVQYGFVIPDNKHDRLDFELFEGYVGTTPLRGAPGAALSLSRIQEFLGDEAFKGLLEGADNALLCALKSIPTYSMEASELPNGSQVLKDERVMLVKLLNKLQEIEEEFTTTLQYDETMQAQISLTAWQRAAVEYRIERKQLAAAARKVLESYEEIVKTGTK